MKIAVVLANNVQFWRNKNQLKWNANLFVINSLTFKLNENEHNFLVL